MPSTATTNVSIGTILDLIGPAAPSIANDQGQSAFDSVLHDSPPTSPSSLQPQPPKRNDHERPTSNAGQNEKPHSQQPAANDCSGDCSNGNNESQESDAAPRADASATSENRPESEHPVEKSDEVQQLIAQSLAGLPAATPTIAPTESAAESSDLATSETGEISSSEELAASKGTNRTARKAVARSQSNSSQTVAPIEELVRSPIQNQSTDQPAGSSENIAQQTTHPQGTEQGISQQAQATDKPATESQNDAEEQSFGQITEPVTEVKSDAGEKSPTSRQEESQASDADPIRPNTRENSTPSADATNVTSTNTTPIVAPQSPNAATLNQAQSSNSSASNHTGAITGSAPRSRLPAQILASATGAAARRSPVEVDAARLLTRVVRAFSAAQERDGEVRLRLSPPELGALRLEVRVENGVLTAHLQTETDSARTAIIENLPALRERLAEQGVRIERFDVDLMQRQPGGMPDQPGGRQPESPEAPPRFVQPARTSRQTAPQPITVSPIAGATGGLNVII